MNKKKSSGPAVVAWLARWGTITLIALRACDVISWSWYALLSPLFSYMVFVRGGTKAVSSNRKTNPKPTSSPDRRLGRGSLLLKRLLRLRFGGKRQTILQRMAAQHITFHTRIC